MIRGRRPQYPNEHAASANRSPEGLADRYALRGGWEFVSFALATLLAVVTFGVTGCRTLTQREQRPSAPEAFRILYDLGLPCPTSPSSYVVVHSAGLHGCSRPPRSAIVPPCAISHTPIHTRGLLLSERARRSVPLAFRGGRGAIALYSLAVRLLLSVAEGQV